MMRALHVLAPAAILICGWAATAEAAEVKNVDFPGSWSQSCSQSALEGNILSARCVKIDGSEQDSQLDITTCAQPASAGNQDGQLICESGLASSVGGGGIGGAEEPAGQGSLPLGTAPEAAPGGPFGNFAGDWIITTERGDRLRVLFRQKGGGLDGDIKLGDGILVIGGNVRADVLDLRWQFGGSNRILKGKGQLTLTGDRTFEGKLVLDDGSALQGGTWSGMRTSESGGAGGGAALPQGGEPGPGQPEAAGQGGGSETAGEILDCGDRDSLKTGDDNGAKVTLSFHNGRDASVTLNWIDRDGKDVGYGTIAPGATLDQSTFGSHLWELTDGDGACVMIYRAANQSEVVEVP